MKSYCIGERETAISVAGSILVGVITYGRPVTGYRPLGGARRLGEGEDDEIHTGKDGDFIKRGVAEIA